MKKENSLTSEVKRTVAFLKEKYDYPQSFIDAMEKTLNTLDDAEIRVIRDFYISPEKLDFFGLTAFLKTITGKYGMHERTVYLFALVVLTPALFENYKKAGVPDTVAFDTVADFKYKYLESMRTENIDGIRPWSWYESFFKLKLFALGRLQFQITAFKGEDVTIEGQTIKKGDKVLAIHIPQSGESLSPVSCDESIRQAKEFFKGEFQSDKTPFTCWSWLLYPENAEIIAKSKNILRFANRFFVFQSGEYDDFNELSPWIFSKTKIDNLDEIPENSSLQIAIKKHLKARKKLGWGYGIFFD